MPSWMMRWGTWPQGCRGRDMEMVAGPARTAGRGTGRKVGSDFSCCVRKTVCSDHHLMRSSRLPGAHSATEPATNRLAWMEAGAPHLPTHNLIRAGGHALYPQRPRAAPCRPRKTEAASAFRYRNRGRQGLLERRRNHPCWSRVTLLPYIVEMTFTLLRGFPTIIPGAQC